MRCTLQDSSTARNNEPVPPESKGTRGRHLRPSRQVLAIVTIAVIVTCFVVAAYTFHFFGQGQTNCWARPASQPNTAIFTVVMANEGLNVGYNGSKYHPIPWPVMNVSLGQNVIIHVINNDTTNPAHGFAITNYFDSGVSLRSGECHDVRFTANQPGSFTVFCNIYCTIHLIMQNGRLNVNP